MPKSITFTAPALLIMMLAGFTSRWMMPCWWLKFSAWQASAITSIARLPGIGPSVTYSITMYGSGPVAVSASPVSYTATMAGWFSAAAFCASRRNRK